MNKFLQYGLSAANWRVPNPWWARVATFGLLFWGSCFIVISLAILTDYKHAEHIDPWLIIIWFVGLLFTCRDAIAFRNLPRYWNCSEPENWKDMTPYDPVGEILGTSSGYFKKKHSDGVDHDTYRDGHGNEYTRYVYPDGRVRWTHWMRSRQKK